jgi:hypothetical protein
VKSLLLDLVIPTAATVLTGNDLFRDIDLTLEIGQFLGEHGNKKSVCT